MSTNDLYIRLLNRAGMSNKDAAALIDAGIGGTVVVDPNTYRSFNGDAPGMFFENNNGSHNGNVIKWDTVYPINAESDGVTVSYEDALVTWVHGDNDGMSSPCLLQSGLFSVTLEVHFSALVLDGTAYEVRLNSRPGTGNFYPDGADSVTSSFMVWLQARGPIERVLVSLEGVTFPDSTISYASMTLAPMFVLDGIDPT